MKRLQEALKKVNGTTTPECSSSSAAASDVDEKASGTIDLADVAHTGISPEDHQYDTVVNFQNGQLVTLSVERVVVRGLGPLVPSESSDAASEKSGSNGSTTSLGMFALPGALTHTASGLSVSSTSSVAFARVVAGDKSRVQGVSGLRSFLQDLLKQLPEETTKRKPGRQPKARATAAAATTTTTTPVKATPATPTRTSTAAATSPKTETDTNTTTTGGGRKKVAFAATDSSATESQVGNFVMARWADKKYYAGRVSAEKPGKKFAVRFEDGATRTLSKDQLVFGDKAVAQVLMSRECNVLVEANIYETGLVVGIDADACTYSVLTDSGTVTVPASDLYLDEEQAKAVQIGCGQMEGGGAEGGAEDATATTTATITTTTGRRKRNSDLLKSSPEAGPSSVAEPAAKKSRKR